MVIYEERINVTFEQLLLEATLFLTCFIRAIAFLLLRKTINTNVINAFSYRLIPEISKRTNLINKPNDMQNLIMLRIIRAANGYIRK